MGAMQIRRCCRAGQRAALMGALLAALGGACQSGRSQVASDASGATAGAETMRPSSFGTAAAERAPGLEPAMPSMGPGAIGGGPVSDTPAMPVCEGGTPVANGCVLPPYSPVAREAELPHEGRAPGYIQQDAPGPEAQDRVQPLRR